MQFWTSDDGRKNRPKHVQRLTEINKLWNVASCWLFSASNLFMLVKKHGKVQLFLYLGLHPQCEITTGLDFQTNRNICCHCWEMKLASSIIDYNPYMGWNKNGLRPPHNLQIPGFITVIFNLANTSVILRLFYARCSTAGSHTLLSDLTQLGCNAVFSASFFNLLAPELLFFFNFGTPCI